MNRNRDSVELKIAAKENLDGKWLVAIAVCLVAWLLIEAFTSNNGANASYKYVMENGSFVRMRDGNNSFRNLMSLVGFIIGGPIYYGVAAFFLKLARHEPAEFSELFSGFSLFKTNFVLNFFIILFTFLWTMLLIVPGIIAGISYSMAYYIVNDDPNVGALEAVRRSKEMMNGNKMRFFEMWLGFLGWFILGVVTLGLGMLYAIPYYRAAKANFYLDLKESYSG
ncbi:MAG: hypothetical protein APF77_20270 [Clostridia bacterium BRH_c25]|nr:MAG: hypothetical protein APF77_20270 [Clostridia bacterium BRH_c25]